jgi:hypothetical protein
MVCISVWHSLKPTPRETETLSLRLKYLLNDPLSTHTRKYKVVLVKHMGPRSAAKRGIVSCPRSPLINMQVSRCTSLSMPRAKRYLKTCR